MVSSVYYSDLSPLLDLGSLLVIILCVAYLLIWLKFYDDMALKRLLHGINLNGRSFFGLHKLP